MKHVIYHTEYYNRNEMFCQREEECDAYFNTLPEDDSANTERRAPIGCRLLQPKLLESQLTKEQWETLAAKKPDYQLRYASMYDVDENQYAIYAIYERVFETDNEPEEYSACVSFGENDEVTLDLCVVPQDHESLDEHMTYWEEVTPQDGEIVKTGNGISIVSSTKPDRDKMVRVSYGAWSITGKWDAMEQESPGIFIYHCHNSLFRFDITFNIERYLWDGNYESLLHE